MDAEELFKKKKAAKKEARRSSEPEEANLGMTSLMDIVAIIVIYLLKSYASDPVLIQPIADQKIPMSRVDAPIQEGTPLYISQREIVFMEKKLVALKDGEVDPNAVRNHLIDPLYEEMAVEADKAKQMAEERQTEWDARLIVVGHESVPFSTLVDIMYTAGRAEFTEYAFAVIKKG